MATSKKSKQSLSCITCKLREGDIQSPKMEVYGNGNKKILIIGESPSSVDDRKDMPWQGKMGRLLQSTLKKVDIDLFEDCLCINAVNCMTPRSRAPKPLELDCCREVMVHPVLRDYKPKVILLMGTVALQSFLSPRWPTNLGGIAKWRGFRIPDRDHKAWVIPTFHPSYVSRMDSREVNTVWEQDLVLAAEVVDVEVPRYFDPKVHMITDLADLRKIKGASEVAIDYETTGLKSHGKGHRIVCAAVATNDKEVYAFMIPETRAERQPFVDMLEDMTIGKMAHNMKFEHSWSLNRWGVEIQNWQWDSMLAAHLLDNRTGTTNLKFQTYVNFGMIIKDKDVSEFLYKRDGDGNSFNKIFELIETPEGIEKLLHHVALDAYWEFLLAKMQMKKLGYQYLPF